MRDPRERLQDMFQAIPAIEGYLHRGKAAFEQDELLQAWFVRNLQIIEKCARLRDAFVSRTFEDLCMGKSKRGQQLSGEP